MYFTSLSSLTTMSERLGLERKKREMGKGGSGFVVGGDQMMKWSSGSSSSRSTVGGGQQARTSYGFSLPPGTQQDAKTDKFHSALWDACAGPLACVPECGDLVFYFPQGHIEQVKAYLKEDGISEMPMYDLPSKILCQVAYSERRAETGTDEVFAFLQLFPVGQIEGLRLSEYQNWSSQLKRTGAQVKTFCKKLTQSDTSTHGGFSVPKRYAEECLPPLDMSQPTPAQELVAKDLHKTEWRFRHIFRGQPRRHLITSGWSAFVTSKKLVAGDSIIFIRGDRGDLRLGVRRAMKALNNVSTTLISAHSMQHGILASAFSCLRTGSLFSVYYRPWTCPAEFIVPVDRYMKSAEIGYSVGMRFRMPFEGEESAEYRLEGTVVGIEDFDQSRWPNSEWRNLRVRWDTVSDQFVQPERVSPWNIEPIEPGRNNHAPLLRKPKRPRRSDASVTGFYDLSKHGLLHSHAESSQSNSRVWQGQEKDADVNESGALILPQGFTAPQNPDRNSIQMGFKFRNQQNFPMRIPFHPCPPGNTPSRFHPCPPGNTLSFPGGDSIRLGVPCGWCPTLSSQTPGFQGWTALYSKNSNEAPLAYPSGSSGKCKIFGVDFVNSPRELPSPQVAASSERDSLNSIPPMSQSSVSEPSKSTSGINSEIQCKNSCAITNRSCCCIKVRKHGTTLVRSVDLSRFSGYKELIRELDQMFEFKGSLIDGSSGWKMTYTDDEGDMMLIGDYPWKEFRFTVRRMLICPKEDINMLSPISSV